MDGQRRKFDGDHGAGETSKAAFNGTGPEVAKPAFKVKSKALAVLTIFATSQCSQEWDRVLVRSREKGWPKKATQVNLYNYTCNYLTPTNKEATCMHPCCDVVSILIITHFAFVA
jgi:hypothetical protein